MYYQLNAMQFINGKFNLYIYSYLKIFNMQYIQQIRKILYILIYIIKLTVKNLCM
jgi:hypothetical protein